MVNCKSRPETKRTMLRSTNIPTINLFISFTSPQNVQLRLFFSKKTRREGNKPRERDHAKDELFFLSFVLFIRFDSIGFSVRWKSITFYIVYHSSSLLYYIDQLGEELCI